MGRLKRLSLTLAAVCALTAALAGTSASAAQVTPSTPSNCQAHTIQASGSEGGDAWCFSGTGHVRVQIYCTVSPQYGWGTYYFGPWLVVGTSNVSLAWCPSSQPYVVAAGYDIAPW